MSVQTDIAAIQQRLLVLETRVAELAQTPSGAVRWAVDDGGGTVTSASPTNLTDAAPGPLLDLPAGTWWCLFGAEGNISGGTYAELKLDSGAIPLPVVAFGASVYAPGAKFAFARLSVTTQVSLKYDVLAGGTGSFRRRWLVAVRV